MKNINVWLIVTYVIAFVLAYLVIEKIKKIKLNQSASLRVGNVGAGESVSLGAGYDPNKDPNFNPKTQWNQVIY